MRTRTPTAVLVAACPRLPAGAAGAVRCAQVADPPGDAVDDDRARDLVTVGTGSDSRDLTVTPAATSPLGVHCQGELTLDETRMNVTTAFAAGRPPVYRVRRTTGGSIGSIGWFGIDGPEVSSRVRGVFDPVRDEVRVTVPLAGLAAFGGAKRGATTHRFNAIASRSVPLVADTVFASADVAQGYVMYRLGSPGCTRAGR